MDTICIKFPLSIEELEFSATDRTVLVGLLTTQPARDAMDVEVVATLAVDWRTVVAWIATLFATAVEGLATNRTVFLLRLPAPFG